MISPRIAVIHSDPSVSSMLETLLEEEGYLSIACADIDSTLELFHGSYPDLIIIDIGFGPAHSGWALAEQLCAEPLTHHIPIIALTTAPDLDGARPGNCHARFEMLPSPFDIDIVLGAIRSLLNSPHHCHCS